MSLESFSFVEHWMDEEERRYAEALSVEFEAFLGERHVHASPLLHLRTRDVIVGILMVRRAEASFADQGAEAKRRQEEGDGASDFKTQALLLNTHGRAAERLRKAMRDLEVHCRQVGSPIDVSLANVVRPAMEKLPDVFDDMAKLQRDLLEARDAQKIPPEAGDPIPVDEFV